MNFIYCETNGWYSTSWEKHSCDGTYRCRYIPNTVQLIDPEALLSERKARGPRLCPFYTRDIRDEINIESKKPETGGNAKRTVGTRTGVDNAAERENRR